jgi:FkbM family methyltransferase
MRHADVRPRTEVCSPLMEEGARPAGGRAVPAWASGGSRVPGAKRTSLAFRLLPVLSRLYWLCERTRVLDLSIFRAAYREFYFSYKNLVEDPFSGLVATRPDLLRGGNVVDVGAHIGYTTSLFLRATSPGFRLFAVEPDAANLRELYRTVRRLDTGHRVVVVEAAAGSSDGTVGFWHNSRHPGDHRIASEAFLSRRRVTPMRTVPLRRVDTILAEHGAEGQRLAFVKIDAQGCELAVCKGFGRLLDLNPRAAVAIEYAPGEIEEQGDHPEELLEFFRRRRFALHLLAKDGSAGPATSGHLEAALERRGYADILCLPDGLS